MSAYLDHETTASVHLTIKSGACVYILRSICLFVPATLMPVSNVSTSKLLACQPGCDRRQEKVTRCRCFRYLKRLESTFAAFPLRF